MFAVVPFAFFAFFTFLALMAFTTMVFFVVVICANGAKVLFGACISPLRDIYRCSSDGRGSGLNDGGGKGQKGNEKKMLIHGIRILMKIVFLICAGTWRK